MNFEDVTRRELPFEAPPRILRIELSDASPRSNELLLGRVLTTTNVAVVYIRVSGYQSELVHQDAGVFSFVFNVPDIPFFMKHAIAVSLVAATTDGRSMTVPVPVRLR